MQISLRQARRIVDQLSNYIAKYKLTEKYNVHTPETTQQPEQTLWLNTAVNKTSDKVALQLNMIYVRSTLRRLIQATNEHVGVNDLISARKYVKEVLKVWKEIQQVKENNTNVTSEFLRIQHKLAEEGKSTNKDRFYGSSEEIRVIDIPTIPQQLLNDVADKVKTSNKKLVEIEDQLTSLNSASSIELPQDVVDILQELDLL